MRFLGEIDSAPEAVERLVRKLAKRHRRLAFAYEAGPTGYGLQRQIAALGHDCAVVAPSPVPKRPGERVKTNRRDALTLAKLHRAGELTPVWVPDPGHEAMRELVRAREAAMEDLRAKRQHLQSFLLRHGRVFTGRGAWTKAHTRWLCELRFEHPAQHLVLAEYRQAIADAEARLECLTGQVAELVPSWSMAPVIAAYQALRGVAFLTAVTFVAEIGDVRRFDSPRQLTAYLGLVPSGELDRRTGPARRHHQGRQRPGPARADRGGLDVSLPGADEPAAAGAAGRPAEGRVRRRLEGAAAPVRPLPQAHGPWQTPGGRHRGDRARDGGLPVGDRARGRATIGRLIRSRGFGVARHQRREERA